MGQDTEGERMEVIELDGKDGGPSADRRLLTCGPASS